MVIFKSEHPDIQVPTDLTVWQWLFESEASPLKQHPESELAGFLDYPTKVRVGWRQLEEYATHISTALVRKYGLKPGDTVSLFSRNTVWYPVMLFGTARAGGLISGASPAYGVEEMSYALKTAKAKFLATSPTSIDVALKAAKNAGVPKEHVFILEGSVEGYTGIQDLIAAGRAYGSDGQIPSFSISTDGGNKTNKDVCGFLSFSSGTTGLPKAVMLSHHNVIAQCMQMAGVYEPTHRTVLGVLPFFHISGLLHILHIPLLLNREVVMLPGFSMPTMLSAIQDHRISELLLVPPILIRLVRDPAVDGYDLSSVRAFSSGAAPVSPEVLAQLAARFPAAGFKQGYGMTESTSVATLHPPGTCVWENAGLVGRLVANTEMRIVREADGEDAAVGEPGEVLLRGPQVVTLGYLDRPEATAETFDRDGWLHTGDQGVVDGHGWLRITDRIKELIKVNGVGVAPAELEDVLLGHPHVEDAAVLGVPDATAGEAPKAFVVARPGGPLPGHELGRALLRHVRDNKVRHKWLSEVEFIDAIPKSPSGKILRRNLKEREKAGLRGLVVKADRGGAKVKAKL